MRDLWKKWVSYWGSTFSAVAFPFIFIMIIFAFIGSLESEQEQKAPAAASVEKTKSVEKPKEEITTLREDVSAIYNHLKCFIRMCDEDGHCPVWSNKYSKCYMIDKDGEKWLRWYENNGFSKKRFESENTTY